MCSQLSFKRTLLKLSSKSGFSLDIKYHKQTHSCTIFIYVAKSERSTILSQGKQNYINILLTTALQDLRPTSLTSY